MSRTPLSTQLRAAAPALAGPAAVILVFLIHAAIYMSYLGEPWAWRHLPLDDSWIHLAYAKNLLAHGYFTYNPGDIETGATSPLWALLLAGVLAVVRQPVLAAKLLGLGLGSVCAGLGFIELRRAGGRVAAWVGALMLALDPMWMMGCLSGMEVPLTGLAVLLIIRQLRLGRPAAVGAMMGLAVLARPDMGLAAAGAGALMLWIGWRRIGGGLGRAALARVGRMAAVCAGVSLAITAPWFIYCRLGTGHWLPNTFYVKGQGNFHLGMDKVHLLRDILEHEYWASPLVHDPVCLALLAMGIGCTVYAMRRRPAMLAWLALPLLHILAWVLTTGYCDQGTHRGQYLTFCFTRYYLPDYPAMFGLAGLGAGLLGRGLAELGRRLETGFRPRADRLFKGALAALVAGLLVAGNWIGWYAYVGPLWLIGSGYKKSWVWNAGYNQAACRNIYEIHERTGQWIAANVPPDTVVATQDAGAVRYFTNHRMIDLWGLNSHEYLFTEDKAAYLRRAGVKVAVIFLQGRLDPFFDFQTRMVARFTTIPNMISEGDTMDVREIETRVADTARQRQ